MLILDIENLESDIELRCSITILVWIGRLCAVVELSITFRLLLYHRLQGKLCSCLPTVYCLRAMSSSYRCACTMMSGSGCFVKSAPSSVCHLVCDRPRGLSVKSPMFVLPFVAERCGAFLRLDCLGLGCRNSQYGVRACRRTSLVGALIRKSICYCLQVKCL